MAGRKREAPDVPGSTGLSHGSQVALTIAQVQAAELVAQGLTDSEVARRVRRDRKTIGRWHDQEAFAAEVERLVKLRRRRLRHKVEAAADGAITSVEEIATSVYVDEKTGEKRYLYDAERRTAATRVLLQHAIPTREEIEVTGPEGGPVQVDVTSQSVTLELTKLFGPPKGEEGG